MCASAPSGETKYTWSEDMQPRWNNVLNNAEWWSQSPRNSYPVEDRFAPMHGNLKAAIDNTRDFADLAPSPVDYTDAQGVFHKGSMSAADDFTQKTINGEFLHSDPTARRQNQWANVSPVAERNQFAGQSPWWQGIVKGGMDDITSAYDQGTRADTTRMAVLSGAYGGSAHQQKMANDQAALGKTLANYSNQMENSQYERSANLEQQFLNNNLQNQQLNKQLGGQWAENQMNRESGAYQNAAQRQMQAAGMGYNTQGLALDRLGMLMQTGRLGQEFDQRQKDFEYQDWLDVQNHPYKMIDWLTGNYGRAQGGMGANSTVYGGSGNTGGNILGGLLAAYGLS